MIASFRPLGLLLGACLLASACHAASEPAPKAKRPTRVSVASVVQKPMDHWLDAVGTVEPASTVAIRAQVSGTLLEASFKEGDAVQAGQVLFRIDPAPLEAAVRQADAALARDLAQARHARAEADRYSQLLAQGYVARSQAEQQVASAEALEATVKADEAALASARLQLGYATLRAPMDARAGALGVYPGNLVRAGDATPLVTLHQVKPILVSFSPPQQELPLIQRSMRDRVLEVVATPDGASASIHGTLQFVDNAVDPTTGTIRLKASFTNEEGRLWPGQFVRVALKLSTDPHALVVPSRALQVGQQGSFAFVVGADRKAELRPVAISRREGDETVVESGLAPGEKVVVDGILQLRPGSPVELGDRSEGRAAATRRRRS